MQQSLDINAELFTTRERGLRRLLRDYWLIDSKIAKLTSMANGDGLVNQPSVTAAPPVEDDPWVLAEMAMSPLSELQINIVRTVNQYVDSRGVQYMSRKKVLQILREAVGKDEEDEEVLQMFYSMISESVIDEERVELTDTERLVIRRDKEIREARQQLQAAKEQKRVVDEALSKLKYFRPYFYELLWNRYVMDKPVSQVCDIVGLQWPTQDKTYQAHIRQAMETFGALIPDKVLCEA